MKIGGKNINSGFKLDDFSYKEFIIVDYSGSMR